MFFSASLATKVRPRVRPNKSHLAIQVATNRLIMNSFRGSSRTLNGASHSPLAQRHPGLRCTIRAHAGKGFGAPVKKVIANIEATAPCPCSSGSSYLTCCSKYHSSDELPSTPEQLLRSRYVAYKEKMSNYIADTTYQESAEWSGTRAQYLSAVKQTMKRLECVELKIISQKEGRAPEEHFIEFELAFRDRPLKGDEVLKRKETSRFLKSAGKWYYMDSVLL